MISMQPQMGEFLEACGANGPLVLNVEREGGQTVGRWSLPQPFAILGRDPRIELTLDDEALSRRHAYLQVVGGRVYCLDLGSRVGVVWDGIVAHSGWLDLGQAITIGPYRIVLEGGVPENSSGALLRPNPLAILDDTARALLPPVHIEFPRKEGPFKSSRLKQVLTLIGRAADCRIQIRDDAISRYHAALLRLPGGVWVVDLSSRDGIRVNGVRVKWSRLVDGDHLHVGRYRMVVHVGTTAESEASDGSDSGDDHDFVPLLTAEQFPALRSGQGLLASIDPGSDRFRQLVAGRPPDQVALAESLLRPLVEEFGQMQRQMFDQYQSAFLNMFEMFGTWQRDQMAQVRTEIERIRQLSHDLERLQTKLERTDSESAPNASAKPSPAIERNARQSSHTAPALSPTDPPPPEASKANQSAPPPQNPKPKRETRVADGNAPRERPTIAPTDLHDQIARRIRELQSERQSRWQRLLTLLGGAGKVGG